jgi:hypothetical protein
MKDIIKLQTFVDYDHVRRIGNSLGVYFLSKKNINDILNLVEDRFEDVIVAMVQQAILDISEKQEEENYLSSEEQKEKIA